MSVENLSSQNNETNEQKNEIKTPNNQNYDFDSRVEPPSVNPAPDLPEAHKPEETDSSLQNALDSYDFDSRVGDEISDGDFDSNATSFDYDFDERVVSDVDQTPENPENAESVDDNEMSNSESTNNDNADISDTSSIAENDQFIDNNELPVPEESPDKAENMAARNNQSVEKTDTRSNNEVPSELTDTQKAKLIDVGVSPGMIDKIVQLDDGKYEMQTTNNNLEGKKHPETEVSFERKTIDVGGIQIEGVFPVFESKFDAQLPEDKLRASDSVQFNECNKQLKEEISKNPDLKKEFTPRQLELIESGHTPSGYVWHHNEETGKMQLVEFDTHKTTNHTGGRAVWGGGKDAR